ncbi:MAG: lipopolysaccharide transport periplasmic protein LptA [Acidithiobacillus ferriphilus]|nr:lipopolysaccharide transport periplasmic protein LptA [Acidithiobacillus ferriphilus]MBU2832093.1 lipopolysaccharide transport periplasmic protein LptA [Acidithiobacillus ferriphilus]MBW9250165.1 lipopolysaccharide transport periplasmic protein LptA [Acidithiobacillus ferriphilus]MBW9255710.1 lipopolysaccharide transport periplasmic protein LptA [Acidithiobacillus ferriphilus]
MCVACMFLKRFSFRRFWPFLLVAVSITALAAPVAEQGLAKGPIQISADTLYGKNKPQQQAVYTGNVVMIQGDVVIHADKLTIDAAGGKVRQATAVGSPVTITMSSAQRHGYGDTLVYKPASGEIVLIGNAHLWQGKNEINGQQVTYFLRNQQTAVTGNPGQRVRSVFYPAAAGRSTSGGKP